MAQVIERPFECLNCHKSIRLERLEPTAGENKASWRKYELDGITILKCRNRKKEQQQQQKSNTQLGGEDMSIHELLQVINMKLDKVLENQAIK